MNSHRLFALGMAVLMGLSLSACAFGNKQSGPINQSHGGGGNNIDEPSELPDNPAELPEVDINDLPVFGEGENAPGADQDEPEETQYANDWTYSWICYEPVEHYKFTDDRSQLLVSMRYQLPHLSEEAKEKYPELDSAVRTADDLLATEMENLYIADCNGVNSLSQEDIDSRIEDFGCVRGNDSKLLIRRSSGDVFSFLNVRDDKIAYEFLNYNFTGFNYDMNTGKPIELEDFVSDVDALYELVAEKALAQKKDWEERFFGKAFDVDVDVFNESVRNSVPYGGGTWTLDNQGVTFYFDTGSIGYVFMQVQVLFSEDTEGKIFNGKYSEPDSWTVYLLDPMEYEFTNEEGGPVNTIQSTGYQYEDEYLYTECFYYNGTDYTRSFEGSNAAHVLAHKGDNTWLYSFCYEYWYSKLDIYEFTSTGVSLTAENYLSPAGYPEGVDKLNEKAGYYAYPIFTDMDNIIFCQRTYVLSTCDSNVHYSLERDGSLYMLDDYFYFTEATQFVLTTVIDLPDQEVVNKKGDTTGEYVSIPSGAKMMMIRTNGKDLVDFEMDDGTLVRLHIVDGKDYGSEYGTGLLVSGAYVDKFDVFDVLMFAQ